MLNYTFALKLGIKFSTSLFDKLLGTNDGFFIFTKVVMNKHSVEIMESHDLELHEDIKEHPAVEAEGEESLDKEKEEDQKADWSTIKVFIRSKPKALDADAKLSEDDIYQIMLDHAGEDRARILANMAVTVSKITFQH